MGRPKGTGVKGPFLHHGKWRIEIRTAGGRETFQRYDDEATARRIADSLRARAIGSTRSVSQAIDEYKTHLVAKGNKPRSYDATIWRLRTFFGDEVLKSPLSLLTPDRASACYLALAGATKTVTGPDGKEAEVPRYAADSHRNMLAEARTFGAWCSHADRRWLKTNPLASVNGTGKRRRGKEQLRVDELRAWFRVALKLADDGEAGAIAALCTVLLAMRAGEIVNRVVRDLDDGGRLLWIPAAKTPAGRRTLEVPDVLQPLLRGLAEAKLPLSPLFGRDGVPFDRTWPNEWVHRICRLAGVPEVTAHGMRGAHVTLARTAGATGHLVASQLGHEDVRMQEIASAREGSIADSARRGVLGVINGGRSPDGAGSK